MIAPDAEIRHYLHAGWIGERLEPQRNMQGVVITDRTGCHGCTAHRGGHVDHRQRLGHDSILPWVLTYIKKVAC